MAMNYSAAKRFTTMQDDNAVEAVREDGQDHGRDLSYTAGDCPFGVDQMVLRQSWLDGFSAGRIILHAAQPDNTFNKEDSPEAQADRPAVVEGR
jgi:hypothetical protein